MHTDTAAGLLSCGIFFAFFFPFFFKHIVFVMIARQSRLIKKKGDYFYESK